MINISCWTRCPFVTARSCMKSVTLLFHYAFSRFYLCYIITERSVRHNKQTKKKRYKNQMFPSEKSIHSDRKLEKMLIQSSVLAALTPRLVPELLSQDDTTKMGLTTRWSLLLHVTFFFLLLRPVLYIWHSFLGSGIASQTQGLNIKTTLLQSPLLLRSHQELLQISPCSTPTPSPDVGESVWVNSSSWDVCCNKIIKEIVAKMGTWQILCAFTTRKILITSPRLAIKEHFSSWNNPSESRGANLFLFITQSGSSGVP